jgi:rubredoxin
MAMDFERSCPNCNEEKTFYRAASTELHIGQKIKWRCPDCDYGFVQIDSIDTGAEA